ncbi:MAG TPA: VIT1/CCC1 transporter family protein [Candidatus Polarisedimenticolaceae bacterium]|nr:VIT1/CCC1 transporter family protein [Candidatus Polarisedimenticolaceae bacterium]
MSVAPETIARWKHHLQDEADAAFLYGVLAEAEPDADRRAVYKNLEDVEQRHVGVWREVFSRHELSVEPPRPSARARLLAWTARRLGPAALTTALWREEGTEVKRYLRLHRESERGPGRDAALQLARESAEHARTLGDLSSAGAEPWHHTASGGFLRNVVYGFNDGLTANFGLVAGVIGADVPARVVLLSGVAGMIADALSMGASGYLAAKSEQEVYANEREMERDEILLMPELEQEELALAYQARGVARDQAQLMAQEVLRDPERALAEQVREELGIAEAHFTPLREGWITGAATAVGAFIPVLPFLAFHGPLAVWTSFALAMAAHFGVGAARTFFTGRPMLKSGIDMLVVGFGVALVGYLVGDAAAKWLHTGTVP